MVGYKMFDYESPIEAIVGQIQTQFEDDCVKAVQSYGFNINKEELKKALLYDRGQYEKGYAAAKAEFKRPEGTWLKGDYYCETIGAFDDWGYWCVCSECGSQLKHKRNYCPNCGADMRGDE